MSNTKQKTYHVREDLARVIAAYAGREDRREYEVVNEAFDYFINIKLSPEERKALGYVEQKTSKKKEKK